MTGKLLSEALGKVQFFLMLIGFNLTFGPMHILGMQGQPRRYYRVVPGQGHDLWNFVETIGAFVIALSILVFIINVLITLRRGKDAGDDPWDARTIEWSIPNPTPHYNFLEIPVVKERDDFWHRKYAEDEAGRAVPIMAGGSDEAPARLVEGPPDADHPEPHMPKPSYWPLVAAIGIPLIAYGLMFQWALAAVGGLVLLTGIYGWALEPVE